jgi:isocitrate dehydrogenase (NAD+)
VQYAVKKFIPATLIPGDGIGPEIIDATVKVLDALGAPFAWEVHKAHTATVRIRYVCHGLESIENLRSVGHCFSDVGKGAQALH